ncbi:MAG: DUF6173 family protein [Lachnospiraceae bacterium]|nr:DUF6173 family protein [Lachnospiraceae bacterium]
MDSINSILKSSATLREFSNRPQLPYGTDAASHFEILKKYINEFQNNLDSEHEVGMLLTNFGQNILLNVSYISYENPSLLIFKGFVQNQEATLIQNVNQLNFLLSSIPKEPDRPKRKIGFSTDSEE